MNKKSEISSTEDEKNDFFQECVPVSWFDKVESWKLSNDPAKGKAMKQYSLQAGNL